MFQQGFENVKNTGWDSERGIAALLKETLFSGNAIYT